MIIVISNNPSNAKATFLSDEYPRARVSVIFRFFASFRIGQIRGTNSIRVRVMA